MDTLPLPPQPSLEQYRKRAKGLVAASKSGIDSAVHEWAAEWLKSLSSALGVEQTQFVRDSMTRAVQHIEERVRAAGERDGLDRNRRENVAQQRDASNDKSLTLASAQHLIAGAHGFESWASFANHLEDTGRGVVQDDFERGADAVVSGDIDTLRALLRDRPELVHEHSRRVHHATLLHYVAANGVEDFRQKTPPNAVQIAELLLHAGAKPDALADTYGSDYYQTTMNLLVSSTHPAEAGLQSKLVETLLDHGAAIDGVRNDSSPLFTALEFSYRDAAETLVRRGAAIDNVITAAAIGDLEFVKGAVVDADTIRADIALRTPAWRKLDSATSHIEYALAFACKFGRSPVAEHLLALGVSPRSKDGHDMTALHWAAATGMTSVVEELLRRGAPLEARNAWEGTVLGSTLHFATQDPQPGVDYTRIVERLLEAGADVNSVWYPCGNSAIDTVLKKYGAR
jgi:hypothetical protein